MGKLKAIYACTYFVVRTYFSLKRTFYPILWISFKFVNRAVETADDPWQFLSYSAHFSKIGNDHGDESAPLLLAVVQSSC